MGFDGSLRPRSTPVQRPPFVGVPYQQPSQSAGIVPHPLMHVHPPVNVPIPASTIAPPPQVGPEGNTNNGVHTVGTVINDSPPDEPAHHMEVEEEKEGHGRTLSRRISALRESGIGLDVEFHVGPSHNLKIVRAHRAVLASGSKAFEKLLYDVEQNAPPNKKCKQSNSAQCDLMVLEYQDVNPIAFDTIINFLYSDFGPKSINIDEAVVLDTLYAARKFDVEQVESACIMLLGDLTPSVAVALLGQAKKHCSEQLMQKCLEVIDAQTDDALAADSWTRLSKEMLKTVVERSELAPSEEIMVFRAVCAWADAECARAGCKSATSQKKRDLLGDVFNAVRFPTMSVSEFAEVANSGMLTDEEIGLLFRYISSTIRPALNLPFPTSERRYTGRSKHVVKRFMTISNNPCRKLRSSIW
ncbi:unnamed protein product [Toxocara canis]|uniref:BTB domain-containing protein n=1 Tax=Toxocara canis TaxID=6265 RepID=A0A183TY79_TOXCA|nr:unnamed protein product [Toxocara canis]